MYDLQKQVICILERMFEIQKIVIEIQQTQEIIENEIVNINTKITELEKNK